MTLDCQLCSVAVAAGAISVAGAPDSWVRLVDTRLIWYAFDKGTWLASLKWSYNLTIRVLQVWLMVNQCNKSLEIIVSQSWKFRTNTWKGSHSSSYWCYTQFNAGNDMEWSIIMYNNYPSNPHSLRRRIGISKRRPESVLAAFELCVAPCPTSSSEGIPNLPGYMKPPLVGGWPTPLKNMTSSDWIIIPNIGEKNVLNHQPASYICIYNVFVCWTLWQQQQEKTWYDSASFWGSNIQFAGMFSCNHENGWSATHWLNYPKLMYINI